MNSRREFLRKVAGSTGLPILSANAGRAATITSREDALLDDLSRRCFQYFWEQSDGNTGIARDRARADGSPHPLDARYTGSTGATGFGLASLCIGAERGWIGRKQAAERARTVLSSYARGPVRNEHGWFYHFVDVRNGKRMPNSEVSTSDSTWLTAGALTARQYFQEDPLIGQLAQSIYERVDYQWMLDQSPYFLAHGWTPEGGFLPFHYDRYCQLACMYLLGIASPTHALKPSVWYAWARDPFQYERYKYFGRTLLWTYQFPFAWWDFRGRREAKGERVDWFRNSATATYAHRAFCNDLRREFPGYGADLWGITSSDGPSAYQTWGGPPRTGAIDGSVVPCAAAGSLMFTPEICLPALETMKSKFGGRIYQRYGFVDAFNPNTGWRAPDVIGIDVGITLLSAENLRGGNVWKWFMANPEAQRAFRLANIEPV